MLPVQLGNPFGNVPFFVLRNAGDYAGDASAAPELKLSKNGGQPVQAYGQVVSAGSGLFWLMGDARDRDTLGPVQIIVTAPAGDVPIPEMYAVVNYDPYTQPASQAASVNVSGGLSPTDSANLAALLASALRSENNLRLLDQNDLIQSLKGKIQ